MNAHHKKTLALVSIILLNITVPFYAALSTSCAPAQRETDCSGFTALTRWIVSLCRSRKPTIWEEMAAQCKTNLDLENILRSQPHCTITPISAITGFESLDDIPFAPRSEYSVNGYYDEFILYQNNIPMGYVAYEIENRHEAMIHRLGIKESHQGKGLGSLLMRYVIRLLEGQGCKKVSLNAITPELKRKRVFASYKKFGFKLVHAQSFLFEYIIPKS